MKASNLTLKSDVFPAATASRPNKTHGPRLAMRFAATMILTALVAGSLYFGASVSASRTEPAKRLKGVVSEKIAVPPGVDVNGSGSILRTIAPMLIPQAGPTVVTYASDCVTPKSSFNLGEVVCAKTDGVDLVTVPGNHYMNWIDSQLNETNGGTITQNPQFFLFAPPTADTWKATIGRVTPPDSSIVGNPPIFTVSSDRPGIGIFAGDGGGGCTNTPKSVFNLQDTNKDVCAKVVGGQANQHILWSNAEFKLVQDVPLGTGENVFTLSALSSLGDWRVILYEPLGGSVYAVTPFTVIDAANPSADLTISKSSADDTVATGSQAVFSVQVTNLGPTDATNVQITDSVPLNTTFASFAAVFAPMGTNCVLPSVGSSSGESICTIPILARGETATFVAAYDVTGTSGTVISNTATVASTQPTMSDPPAVPDPNAANNSSTAEVRVAGTTGETCTLDCPANVVVTADTTQGGEPGAFVTYSAGVPSGNCGAVTNSPASGSFFTVGTHSIVSQSDLNGGTCTFTVTVLDSNPPTITCPANVTVTAPEGETQTNVDPGTPTINASGGGTVIGLRSDDDADPDTPPKPLTDPYPVGTTGIHWTVTDAGGRTASCDQSITVLAANARPAVTISCPANVSATAPEGSCEATISAATIGTPTTNPSDNDVDVTPQRSDGLSLSAPFPGGTTQITWTAHDNITNTSASCVQTVTVTVPGDTTPPTLTVPANISETTTSCTATIEDLGEATATDSGACGGGSVTISRSGVPPGNVFPTGTTLITYTATDGAGNTATAVQMVTVTESPAVPPTITAPADVTAFTGPGATSCGTVVSDATLGTAIASDNCPGVTVTRTGVPAGNVFPVGNTTVTYRATDRSGNFTEDTQVVTVNDNTPPVVTPPGPVTLFTGPGATSCSVTVTDLDATLGVGTATDNCPGVGAVTRSGVPAGNVFPVGETIVTYSVTDAHGNTDSETQTVTVVDNTAPVISCPANIVIEPTCPSGAIATYSTPTATDNCGVQSVVRTAGLASGSVFPIGTTTVTHEATDIHGNKASCSFTVTVLTPQAVIQNLQAAVTASSLTGTQKNGLLAKLNAALQAINSGQTNVACNKLNDFINSVQNLVSHGDLPAATGNAWISSANNVRNTIGCTNLPCS